MKKHLKKTEVLKEGYIKGLKKAQSIIESAIAGESEPKEHVLWGDDWETVDSIMEDIRNSAKEEPEMYEYLFDDEGEIDEDVLRDAAYEDTSLFFDDEMDELTSAYDGEVIVRGRLGLWNGGREVEKEFDDIRDAISHCMQDYNKIYVYESDLCVSATHHDGTNYFTIYGINEEALAALDKKYEDEPYVDFYNAESLMYNYGNGEITEEEFEACLLPLGPIIAKHYGWKN